jgi:hypothetical protein
MAVTLSIRTPSPAAVCDTSLPALLNVARSLPIPLAGVEVLFLPGVAAGAAEPTPKSDLNPSKLLLMSIRIAPRRVYRLFRS